MKLRLAMRTPAEVGIDRSAMRIEAFVSIAARFDSSDCVASKIRRASSDTNFTLRSGPRRIDGTPAATSRFTTLVIAGDADSTGKGRTGAFGKGSGSRATASMLVSGRGVVPAEVFLRGLSHFSQRMLSVTSRPHMKHFRAMFPLRRGKILRQVW